MTYMHFGSFISSFDAYGDRVALVMRPFLRTEQTTYAMLHTETYQAAHYLAGLGLQTGDRIMIVAPNAPIWVKLFLGAQLLGVIVVPVDASSTLATVQQYIAQTTPKQVFRGMHVLPALDDMQTTIAIETVYERLQHQPKTAPRITTSSEQASVIVFTSGTTADPKGVVLTQGNILANIVGVHAALTIDPNWRFLSILPLSHMYELTAGCLTILSGGATIYYLPYSTPSAISQGLAQYRITALLAVPQVASLFLAKIQQTAAAQGQATQLRRALRLARFMPFPTRRLLFRKVHKGLGGHLQFMAIGGAALPPEVASVWERMGIKMLQGYGLTETSPVLAMNSFKGRRFDSPGQAMQGVDLRIAADTGEIQAKGPSVFSGYWHNVHATRAAFTKDGWFKTGDVGEILNGWLHIRGRTRFMIVLSSGLKVFPEDIEAAAKTQPIIQEMCVVAARRPNEAGEMVRAVIRSTASDAQIGAAIDALNTHLGSFQHITDWLRYPQPDFPRTRLLKVDRRKVEDWANSPAANRATATELVPVNTDQVVTIIRLVLGKPSMPIRETDKLANLGLDSLRRLTVVSLIEERLGVQIAESAITQTTTLAKLRTLIADGDVVTAVHIPSWQYARSVRVFGNWFREYLVRAAIRPWVTHIQVEGQEHLDGLKTPAIFIFNHVDNFDGPVLYQALPRTIRNRLAAAVADDVLAEHAILAFVARFGFGGFDFARQEPFLPSLTYVGSLLDKGWNIAIAPEGKISKSGELQPFKSGIGLLAAETGAPVVPVKTIGLFGTVPLHKNWPVKRSKVTVRIGEPIHFSSNDAYDEVTKLLEAKMREL